MNYSGKPMKDWQQQMYEERLTFMMYEVSYKYDKKYV